MDKLNDFMTFLIQSLQQGKDFITAEAPATVRQVLAYYFYLDLLLILGCILAAFPQVYFFMYNWKQTTSKNKYDKDANVAMCIIPRCQHAPNLNRLPL